jgi:hypothetical protein
MSSTANHHCPCCGYRTLREKPPGTFQLCPVCFWEDDSVQFDDHSYEGGANRPSLNQARRSFEKCGACAKRFKDQVRMPKKKEDREAPWIESGAA